VIRFRPYPLLSGFSAAGLALLVALGLWQLDRAGGKAEHIAAFERLHAAGPITLAAALCGEETPVAGQPVIAPPFGEEQSSVRFYGRDASGAPGWRVFQPVAAPDCLSVSTMLAETAFLPLGDAQASAAPGGFRLATPLRAGAFTPPAEANSAAFYAFERDAVAGALALRPEELHEGFWLERDDGGLPPRLAATPPSRHVGYALTWFGLAAALLGVYAAFHVARGRLSFT